MIVVHLTVIVLLFGLSKGNYLYDSFDTINSPLRFAGKLQEKLLSRNGTNISAECCAELSHYIQGLTKEEMWALRMFDAGAKIPSGTFTGNLFLLGAFDQCLNIAEDKGVEEKILGKYCIGTFTFRNNFEQIKKANKMVSNNVWLQSLKIQNPADGIKGILIAVCIPQACSSREIEEIYSTIDVPITVSESLRQSKKKIMQPKLGNGDIATITFFVALLGIVIISTVYEIYICYFKCESPWSSLLIAFSIITNGKKLLSTKSSVSQISCMYGIRVISTMWIILGHRYQILDVFPVVNLLEMKDFEKEEGRMFRIQMNLSVDTFLLMAGIVVSYNYLNAMKNGIKFNILSYYIHRYLRLTPALTVLIVLYATLLKHMGSGPLFFFYLENRLAAACRKYWWKALLYIQNYGHYDALCVDHSWYLCVDMQLFLLSPLILISLKKWPKHTLFSTGFLVVCSIIGCFLVAWFDELRAFPVTNINHYYYQHNYYNPTHTRAGPWLIGILLSYFIFKIRQRKEEFKINKVIVLSLWIISLTLLCICVFAGHNLITGKYNKLLNSMHIALVRPVWAIAVGWIILLCVAGYGGPVNWFLSLPIFEVSSKLTYSLYLVHIAIQHVTTAQLKTPGEIGDLQAMCSFWGDFAFSLAASTVLVLAIEYPVIAIESFLNKGCN